MWSYGGYQVTKPLWFHYSLANVSVQFSNLSTRNKNEHTEKCKHEPSDEILFNITYICL